MPLNKETTPKQTKANYITQIIWLFNSNDMLTGLGQGGQTFWWEDRITGFFIILG